MIGHFMIKYDFSPSAMILGLVLGKMMEESFRRQLMLTNDYMTFFTQPISALILSVSILSVVYPMIANVIKKKKEANNSSINKTG
ncbi:hypothetical protein CVD28_10955 [Bacillus sp. M6-12]|nr:hypothetical protein CVD28_10955 [Bacillus sp. M6-12]